MTTASPPGPPGPPEPSDPPEPPRLPVHTVRCPEDFLALAPVVLGFSPQESVVMLTFGAERPFHARVDLPPLAVQDDEVLAAFADLLAAPAGRHGVRVAVLLYFTADPAAARCVHGTLVRALRRAGVALLLALVADDGRFGDIDDPDSSWRPYDVDGHPFVLDAVVEGRLTHRSRADLVASLDPDPARVARVERLLVVGGLSDSGVPVGAGALRAHADWVRSTLRDAIGAGTEPSDETVARLLWVLRAPRVRDAAWSLLDRATAASQVRWWRSVVRAAPDALAVPAVGLLGFSAWQAGDGALAWAAVDRCLRLAPEDVTACSLADILHNAVPPDAWPHDVDWTAGLPPQARGA